MSNAMREWLASTQGTNGVRGLFVVGDIVRYHEKWGVCIGYKFSGTPHWSWYEYDGTYIDDTSSLDLEITAPYPHDYGHFPDTVLVRATAAKLTA